MLQKVTRAWNELYYLARPMQKKLRDLKVKVRGQNSGDQNEKSLDQRFR